MLALQSLGIGLLAGVSGGLFGIGGGIIIVPLLIYFFDYGQKSATATSLVSLLLPTGALGVWHYYKSGIIEKEHLFIGGLIAIGLFIGVFFGSKIAIHLSSKILSRLFSIFLVIVALRLWLTAK